MGSIVLLDLMGGVALLLWGLHMVHSGIVRACGAETSACVRRNNNPMPNQTITATNASVMP